MRYIVFCLLLLSLVSCEKYSAEHSGINNVTDEKTSVEQASSGKVLSYLDQPLQGKVSHAGIYRMVRSGGIVKSAKTSTGKAVAKPVIERIRSTDRIPLIKGVHMHLQYRIWPLPARPAHAELRRVLKHPEMTLPDGTVSTGSDFIIKRKLSSNQVIAYTGYGFDEDYELVEGEWSFEIWYKDKKVIDHTFTTYRADEDEIATLKPLLELGNGAVGEVKSSDLQNSKMNWSRVFVGRSNFSDASNP
jgi:hypothetical protein